MKTETTAPAVQAFKSSGGARIYQMPLNAFPGLDGYAYLVLVEDYRVMIDTGSGFGSSNENLEADLSVVSEMETAKGHSAIDLASLTHILITHCHIDHFGGLSYVRPRSPAKLGVHELDRRNLTNYEERLMMAAKRLSEFLIEAGVSGEARQGVMDMYTMTKSIFRSVPVDFTYEAEGMKLGPFEILHVPGHSAGHVVIRLHDVLFSGDHVLAETSPHQSPEHLTLSTGLDHYLHSLDLVKGWAKGVRLTLGGHKEPVRDLAGRVDEIKALHKERLAKVTNILRQPNTIASVSHDLFGELHGYNVLLALEETGAHVEYLYQRGLLEIENLDEMKKEQGPVAIRYRCIECSQA